MQELDAMKMGTRTDVECSWNVRRMCENIEESTERVVCACVRVWEQARGRRYMCRKSDIKQGRKCVACTCVGAGASKRYKARVCPRVFAHVGASCYEHVSAQCANVANLKHMSFC